MVVVVVNGVVDWQVVATRKEATAVVENLVELRGKVVREMRR